jgi:hypothetical protein
MIVLTGIPATIYNFFSANQTVRALIFCVAVNNAGVGNSDSLFCERRPGHGLSQVREKKRLVTP